MLKMINTIKILKMMAVAMCLLLHTQWSAAQTVVQASIDSTMIMIGEQTSVHLEVVTGKDNPVGWPIVTDTLTRGIIVLEAGKRDTSITDNNRLLIKQDFLVTSFDSALYVIPPFIVTSGTDTLKSNVMVLKVVTYTDVDPEKGIYDIKPVMTPDFVLADYYPYIFGIMGGLFLFCVIMYILQKRKKKEPVFSFMKKEPKLPPHLEAISKLDKIKVEKLWQQGRNKEYFTQITEVLRQYIMRRFQVNAMEMTSEEILSEIYRLHDVHSVYDTLKHVLELADLVKFAKYVPLPNDNEMSILNAYLFVNQTKIEELQNPAGEGNATTEPVTEKEDQANR